MTDNDLDGLVERLEAVAEHINAIGAKVCRDAAAAIIRLRGDRDEVLEELSIWKSVFPDIAPRSVIPDVSSIIARAEAAERKCVNLCADVEKLRHEKGVAWKSQADMADRYIKAAQDATRERLAREAAEAELAKAREALKPFAEAADSIGDYPSDASMPEFCVTAGDLRRARAIMEKPDA